MNRASLVVAAFGAVMSSLVLAQSGPPLAGVWNIAPTGSAGSSGELVFRVTRGDGSDPVDITVPVLLGASQDTIARGIRNALSSQLGRNRYQVQLGEGGNVLVSDPRGRPEFALELLDADVENLRVAVQSVTPAAAPTVPTQTVPTQVPVAPPANAPVPAPAAPAPAPSAPVTSPPAPAPSPSMPVPNPSPPPNATGGSGAPASAPPPSAGAPPGG